MLTDTHCHINMLVKKEFDVPLTSIDMQSVPNEIEQAKKHNVNRIINVGTSLIESINCISLAQKFPSMWSTVGIHPNDCTTDWVNDFKEIKKLVKNKEENKIVGIGETGIDRHYPDYNLARQQAAFRAQIELALEHDLALVVHSRDAADETLHILEEYKGQISKGIMHCFSYDQPIAFQTIDLGFVLGIGGTITYPKNEELRSIAKNIPLEKIVLETDAPFLPPQIIRGKRNHPLYIKIIAEFLSELRSESFNTIASETTKNAIRIFQIT